MTSKKTAFVPFANEADVISVGNLTLENRLDRITVSGDVDLTADRRGLAAARELQALISAVVASLEARDLPGQLPAPDVGNVDNPFS